LSGRFPWANTWSRVGELHAADFKAAPLSAAHQENWFRFVKNGRAGSRRFCFGGLRRRTPGLSPFSSMNWMAAAQVLFDDFQCLWIAGIAPDLDVVDRVSMETGCLRGFGQSNPAQLLPFGLVHFQHRGRGRIALRRKAFSREGRC
jgi:hypothetical protein